MIEIEPSLLKKYEKNGAVCLRGIFDSSWLESLSRGIEKNFANPGPDHTNYTKPGDPGGFYDDYCNWQRIEEYRQFIYNSPAAEIAAKLMRSSSAKIYHEHVLIKEPGTREITPWHHDQPYYGVDGDQVCSIWLPLDLVPIHVCPQFVAGSHAPGIYYYPRLFLNHQDYAADIPGFKSLPNIDATINDYKILQWHLEPGDCIIFHMRTIHGAPATTGLKSRRRGFSSRWLGDDARFAIRPWKTSPPYREVNLNHGDEMVHSSFPTIWSNN